MKYADVTVGQQVLYSPHRANSPFSRTHQCEMATVTETGVVHRYWVAANGRHEPRTTDQGIRLRVSRHDRRDRVRGRPELLPAEYKTVTITAFLYPAKGGMLAEWQAARTAAERRDRTAAAVVAADDELIARFAEHGYQVTLTGSGVLIATADIGRLLAELDQPRHAHLDEPTAERGETTRD